MQVSLHTGFHRFKNRLMSYRAVYIAAFVKAEMGLQMDAALCSQIPGFLMK